MDASLIPAFVELRKKELAKTQYSLEYEDIVLKPNETQVMEAYNELYILVGNSRSLIITSDQGFYGLDVKNRHEHSGLISVTNTDTSKTMATFVRVIWQA